MGIRLFERSSDRLRYVRTCRPSRRPACGDSGNRARAREEVMLATPLLLGMALAQAPKPAPPTDCMIALAQQTSGVTAQVCLAEDELARARTVANKGPEWRQHLEASAAMYRKALGLPAEDTVKEAIIERLLEIYGVSMLNDPSEMTFAFGELMTLKPADVVPL